MLTRTLFHISRQHLDISLVNICLLDGKYVRLIDWGESTHKGMTTASAHRFGYALGFSRGPDWMREDMWRIGTTMASAVFEMPCLRLMTCKKGTLRRILGSCSYYAYLEKYNLHALSARKRASPGFRCSQANWSSLIWNAQVAESATPDALDFISKLVRYDHGLRMSASQALQHPYMLSVPDQ